MMKFKICGKSPGNRFRLTCKAKTNAVKACGWMGVSLRYVCAVKKGGGGGGVSSPTEPSISPPFCQPTSIAPVFSF